jgi:hypothetical protein
MYYCIEFQVVFKIDSILHVDKIVVYKKTTWKGREIQKLNIMTSRHKTTFRKVYTTTNPPARISVVGRHRNRFCFLTGWSYREFVNVYKPLIKYSQQLRLAQ